MAKRTTTDTPADKFTAGPINDEALARHVRVIEGYQDERAAINARIAQSYKDARSAGFNARLLRRIIAERRLDPDTRREQYETLDRYRRSLGMLADLPLGQAAMKAAGADDDDPVFAAPAGARPKAAADDTREWPRNAFAEQTVHRPRRGRGRPRKANGTSQPELPPAA
jgi:uncharacterized protein (UPF0335 family)